MASLIISAWCVQDFYLRVLSPSTFEDNFSVDETNGDTSALAAFRFPVTFRGVNNFTNNIGGGITLLNTRMDAYDEMNFISNTAVFGGGIAMDDRCLVRYLLVKCLYYKITTATA